ncbi:type I phosphomannose isomerase catalytic subunit [Marinirhabdus gelatinilytica]|uniref:Phosphohexomutase n=1 Tax=Marinirhabdus gelatinilytica TaxID=1703343 RepID=A0A370QA42_9FLAO|nr:type I phosphomannose isomerase catalytic subunit [Marinirhabdus gelatinilytica]RDK84890.1 mannose-6-phosphate isomerase type 1 [Marinirhabdus gelatinilytica]
MKHPDLYPLQFIPELKEKVWGGNKLKAILNKEGNGTVGESWEISGVQGTISKVANGALKGQKITDLIESYKDKLVGERVYKKYGSNFPLLFKFIDAHQDLSVQLHPNDTLAQQRHNSFGKTEMWYILQADTNARLILGFNKQLDKTSYSEILEANKIPTVLHSEKVEAGSAYFIEPGLVHAIGAGVLLAEIQQTSDITYRIYDWDRPDTNGQLRQLHTMEALDAIEFTAKAPSITYKDEEDTRVLLKECPYFVTHKLNLTKNFAVHNFENESCKVYMCTQGSAQFVAQDVSIEILKGETILLPASIHEYTIKTKNAIVLEVFIP